MSGPFDEDMRDATVVRPRGAPAPAVPVAPCASRTVRVTL